MYIEGRRKGALIMCGLWIIVPVITAIVIVEGYVDEVFSIFAVGSMVCLMIAVLYYLGEMEMTTVEIKRYNIPNVTSFAGIFMAIVSYVFFFVGLIMHIVYGPLWGVFILVIVLIAMVLIMTIYISVGTKFKSDYKPSN